MNTVTAAEKLATLECYIRTQAINDTAKELGLSRNAVRIRLKGMGVILRPMGHSEVSVEAANGQERLDKIRERLKVAAEYEKTGGAKASPFNKPPVPAEQLLKTLELYIELQNARLVGAKLGVSDVTVLYRLRRLGLQPRKSHSAKSSRFEEVNPKGEIEVVLTRLKAEVEAQKLQE